MEIQVFRRCWRERGLVRHLDKISTQTSTAATYRRREAANLIKLPERSENSNHFPASGSQRDEFFVIFHSAMFLTEVPFVAPGIIVLISFYDSDNLRNFMDFMLFAKSHELFITGGKS